MKKTFTSALFIVVFGAYALYQNFDNSIIATAAQGKSNGTVAVGVPTSNPKPASNPTPVSVPVTKQKGQFADGTYTGEVADAYYGNVQVKVTVSGGKLADLQFLQYPNDRGTSRAINSQAMPILKSEALQAQSAQVNGVSGASDTSAAFEQSLTSALAQAKA